MLRLALLTTAIVALPLAAQERVTDARAVTNPRTGTTLLVQVVDFAPIPGTKRVLRATFYDSRGNVIRMAELDMSIDGAGFSITQGLAALPLQVHPEGEDKFLGWIMVDYDQDELDSWVPFIFDPDARDARDVILNFPRAYDRWGEEPKLGAVWRDEPGDWLLAYTCLDARSSSSSEVCLQRMDEELRPSGARQLASAPDDGKSAFEPVIEKQDRGIILAFFSGSRIRVERRDQETLELIDAAETALPPGTHSPDDLVSDCFEEIGNPEPGAQTRCSGPIVVVFAAKGGPCHEGSQVWTGTIDPVSLKVGNFTPGGFCNYVEHPIDYRKTDLACSAWTQSCALTFCAGASPSAEQDLYCGLVTFYVDTPLGTATSVANKRGQSAVLPTESAIKFTQAFLIEGQNASVVPTHRSPGVGDIEVAGDFAVFWDRGAGDVGNAFVTAGCVDSDRTTCLNGNAFRIYASFAAGGTSDTAHTVELTKDTGYFWFFDQDNVEVVAKVLAACGVNGHHWVFLAGLTDVRVDLIVKSQIGEVREYRNPAGRPFRPVFDTRAFACSEDQIRRARERPLSTALEHTVLEHTELEHTVLEQAAGFGEELVAVSALAGETGTAHGRQRETAVDRCQPRSTALCLTGNRFRVEATYRTGGGAEGAARVVEVTPDTGYLWFFDEKNVEVVLKVLDACAINNRFWVFAAGLTDVRVDITVADTVTGKTRTFTNPLGKDFEPIQNTKAFACR